VAYLDRNERRNLSLPPHRPPGGLWRQLRGGGVTIAVLIVVGLLGMSLYRVPNLTPVAMVVAILVALEDGPLAGTLSAVLSVVFAAYFLSLPGHLGQFSADDLFELGTLAVLAPLAALLVGRVAHRNRELAGQWELSQSMVEEAIQSKSELMNMAAHELRTPVAVIGGYASMLQDEDFGPLSDTIRKPVNVIAGKTRELAGLVDDILMAARLEEEEALAVRVKRLDLRTLVREAVERAQPRVAMVEARLTYELPAQPVMVDADPDHVGRILDNLLNNALSYSESTPVVKLSVTSDPEPQVRVTDNGWGIAAVDWKRIFERFVRLDEPARMHVPGTGLGLAIARDLAERYGGEVILEDSEPGRGSTFGLHFPAAGSLPRVVKADVPPIRSVASRTKHAQGG